MAAHPPGARDFLLGITIIRRFRKEMLSFITEMRRDDGDISHVRMSPRGGLRIALARRPEQPHVPQN